jgi:hypothetical protein
VPDTWTANDERHQPFARRGSLNRARTATRAEEVGVRSHTSQSSDNGRTEVRRTVGTGNPKAPLEERSKDELYNLAEEHDIKGRSRMNKTQLITAIRRRQGSDL